MSKENHQIEVEARAEFGNNASRRLRHAGMIPAIIYGKGVEPRAVAVNADHWKVFSALHSHMVTLVEKERQTPALVREVQYNHLKNYVVHIDFQAVDLNAEIHSTVAIHPFGESYGASHGGILEQELHELPVICRPADLPELIRGDVTALQIGDALTVAQLELPAGVKANIDLETVVFHVVRPREESEASSEETPAAPEAINETKAEARAAEKENKEKK